MQPLKMYTVFTTRRIIITLLLCFSFGEHLFGLADRLTSVVVRGGRITVSLEGQPSVKTERFVRSGTHYLILSFANSVLAGAGRVIHPPGADSTEVDVAQYRLNPDIVHVVVKSGFKISQPVKTVHQAANRYLVALDFMASSPPRVFLDVGHGGYDPGGTGPAGLPESFVNLQVAKKLAARLRKAGIKVELDRTGNAFVSLTRRVAMGDESNSELFLGLYCNASSDQAIHGTTTYYYHQNSYPFARYLENHVAKSLGLSNNGVMKDNLYVIRHTTTHMIDVLIEYAYISNWHEEQLLASPWFRGKIASALATAVIGYFEPGHPSKNPHPVPAPAPKSTLPPGLPVLPPLPAPKPHPVARITAIHRADATIAIDSTGKPTIVDFSMVRGGERYYVVNLEDAVLGGQRRRFHMGAPFSGEVTIDQFSTSPDVVRIAVHGDGGTAYRFEINPTSPDHYVTSIFPVVR